MNNFSAQINDGEMSMFGAMSVGILLCSGSLLHKAMAMFDLVKSNMSSNCADDFVVIKNDRNNLNNNF